MTTMDLDVVRNMDPKWQTLFRYYVGEFQSIAALLNQAADNGSVILPQPFENIFRAFVETPFDDVKVLIVGQDPYPARQYAMGLAFSVPKDADIPASLRNLFMEYVNDLGYPMPTSGDLTPWARQGVLLLNRSLTVREGSPGSHAGIGWHTITDAVVDQLARRNKPLVAVLMGADARTLKPLLWQDGVHIISTAHPSPRSASRGFFGSEIFSRTNNLLEWHLGAKPIDWRLP